MDEKYLALPLYGDIKVTSYSVNKTVKILLEHIDFVSFPLFLLNKDCKVYMPFLQFNRKKNSMLR